MQYTYKITNKNNGEISYLITDKYYPEGDITLPDGYFLLCKTENIPLNIINEIKKGGKIIKYEEFSSNIV